MKITSEQLYQWIELPAAVAKELRAQKHFSLSPHIKEMLLSRGSWKEGVKQLQESIGDDPNGFKILGTMLDLSCEAYERYEERGIPTSIFIETMKFCTRFLGAHYDLYGEYKFVWAWWFPRQLALQEFRVGCLEYEFVEGENDFISVHIPSDADLKQQAVLQSLSAFFDFRKKYFPDWEGTKLYCESWLLSPALKEMLSPDSNIIRFQEMFTVEHTDYSMMEVLDWVFPGHKEISNKLPENTSLQRNMKKYLLQGGKVGWSKGYLNESMCRL